MANEFYRQVGIGVSTLTFAVALATFIFAAATGVVTGLQAGLLFVTSFLLMLRFWWRYNELFVRFLPSRSFWHFLFDFAVSFFGILSVLSVNNIQAWALLGALAMLASIIRCGLSWRESKADSRQKLRRTLAGAAVMLVVMAAVYFLAILVNQIWLSAAAFILVLVFVIYSSTRP